MARALFGPQGQRQILLDRLPTLTTPTLVVWGARDYLLPVQQAHAAVKSLPHGWLSVFPGQDPGIGRLGPSGQGHCSRWASPRLVI